MFLYSLFDTNHREGNINPNAGFFVSFTEEQITHNVDKIISALEWLDRSHILIEAKNCTFKEMAQQLYDTKPKNTHDAWLMFQETFLNSNQVVLVSNISQSKIPTGKASTALSLLKTNDDAHLRGIKPKSDILFIDHASFLQRSWSELGTYIEIFT